MLQITGQQKKVILSFNILVSQIQVSDLFGQKEERSDSFDVPELEVKNLEHGVEYFIMVSGRIPFKFGNILNAEFFNGG